MGHARAYLLLGILAGLIAPAGLLGYQVLFGAPDPRLVILTLVIGGIATLGICGWLIGRRDDALAARNHTLAVLSRQLRVQSVTDALTGLPNRRAFDERLVLETALAARYPRPLAVVMLDLDRFKDINDRHGHPAGDRVLRAVARVLDRQRRASDLVARHGGEEFAAVLPHTDARAALVWAERVRAAIAAIPGLPITASLGVAAVQGPAAVTPEALIEASDRALYAAKEAGRNRVCVDGEDGERRAS
jgi:diguanylate cyclase (GGDEF)-like protein